MPPHQGLETEVKLPLTDTADGITRLQRAGFTVSKPRIFEANTVFDTRRLSLRRAQTLLRLREVERVGTLTYKGPPVRGKHKVREEIEAPLPEPASLPPILRSRGLPHQLVWVRRAFEKRKVRFAMEFSVVH